MRRERNEGMREGKVNIERGRNERGEGVRTERGQRGIRQRGGEWSKEEE